VTILSYYLENSNLLSRNFTRHPLEFQPIFWKIKKAKFRFCCLSHLKEKIGNLFWKKIRVSMWSIILKEN